MGQKIKKRLPLWDTSTYSWFRPISGTALIKNHLDQELYKTDPIKFWGPRIPAHVNRPLAEKFLKQFKASTVDFPNFPAEAFHYFIESAFYFLLADKTPHDESRDLLFKRDAKQWRDDLKLFDKVRQKLATVGPVFNQLRDFDSFAENLPNGRKHYNSGWIVCLDTAKKLQSIIEAIRGAKLDRADSIFPLKEGGIIKLRNKRRGQPPDLKLNLIIRFWADELMEATGDPQYNFMAKLLNTLKLKNPHRGLGNKFTAQAISHRYKNLQKKRLH